MLDVSYYMHKELLLYVQQFSTSGLSIGHIAAAPKQAADRHGACQIGWQTYMHIHRQHVQICGDTA